MEENLLIKLYNLTIFKRVALRMVVLLPITIIILYSKSYNTIWISQFVLLGNLGLPIFEANKKFSKKPMYITLVGYCQTNTNAHIAVIMRSDAKILG